MNQNTAQNMAQSTSEERPVAEVEPSIFVASDGRRIEYTAGSGNVFADLERPDAAELQFKSNLVFCIRQLMREKGLTQAELGEMVGLPQPKISDLFRGRIRGFSSDRLLAIINRLGRSVEVRISAQERAPEEATTRVLVG